VQHLPCRALPTCPAVLVTSTDQSWRRHSHRAAETSSTRNGGTFAAQWGRRLGTEQRQHLQRAQVDSGSRSESGLGAHLWREEGHQGALRLLPQVAVCVGKQEE
jgi:hypothetical protein